MFKAILFHEHIPKSYFYVCKHDLQLPVILPVVSYLPQPFLWHNKATIPLGGTRPVMLTHHCKMASSCQRSGTNYHEGVHQCVKTCSYKNHTQLQCRLGKEVHFKRRQEKEIKQGVCWKR